MEFATKAIHIGSEPDQMTGAIMPPIYMSSTFMLDSPGVSKAGYEYTRANNPNFTMLEKVLAALENAKHATVFSSGIGALTALVNGLLKSGDHVVAIDGLYGGTYRYFTKVAQRFGVQFSTHSPETLDDLDQILRSKPKWLLFETPTNPLLEVFDIAAYAQVAKRYGVLTIVDNTFATPYSQNPLDLGADIVWHSTTKYIGGHSDVIGGVIMTNDGFIHEQLMFARKSVGTNPSPFDCWLIMRGVKTLAIRMKQHGENARAVAEFLHAHPKVVKTYYPGLTSHRKHEIAKKQMRHFGGMVSAEFKLSGEDTKKLISSFNLFALAESLGGVESLVNHPVSMTHASIPEAERKRLGVVDSLVRFSIGIEDSKDLIQDLSKGLARF